MNTGKKTFNNLLFPLFASAGGWMIYTQGTNLSSGQLLLPTLLVAIYGILISLNLKGCSEALGDHYTDSIYFMGFLYTLMALVTLFTSLNETIGQGESTETIQQVFSMVGVSVTTSIAGVLFRNMVRASFMKNQKDPEDSMAKSYEILQEIALTFSDSYKNTFDSIGDFLSERKENLQLFNHREKEYLDSLDRFSRSSTSFCEVLDQQRSALEHSVTGVSGALQSQTEELRMFQKALGDLREEMSRLGKDCDRVPIVQFSDGIKELGQDTRELDAVLDSMISMVDRKLEQAAV